MRIATVLLATLALASAKQAKAQTSSDTLITITVPLKHLSPRDAMGLLQPFVTTPQYANSPGGGVFPVPDGSAITIREKAYNYGRMLKMLKEYDRSPATAAFTFQLIIADNSGRRDPEIAALDTLLRSVLKFTGYRLMGVGVLSTGETAYAMETIVAEGQKFTLSMKVTDIRTSGADASVKLDVSLTRAMAAGKGSSAGQETLLTTGVTVPAGQTVVLGSAALDKQRAIILTVRPQLVTGTPGSKEN